MNTENNLITYNRTTWQVPTMQTPLWLGKSKAYCVVIPVINEGNRIKNLLSRMKKSGISQIADILIVDGGSTDGSLEHDFLEDMSVRALIIKTGPGKLSAQLRCAYAFALDNNYEGVVTIDGNDKDDPEAIPRFIEELKNGVDFVQASRFVQGGVAINTPWSRDLAIRFIHAPLLSVFSGFRWTDTTQGFRGYSHILLKDPDLNIFRDVFESYELLVYMNYRAPRLGYKCIEAPTVREYPIGEVPTKINGLRGNIKLMFTLIATCLGKFNSKKTS